MSLAAAIFLISGRARSAVMSLKMFCGNVTHATSDINTDPGGRKGNQMDTDKIKMMFNLMEYDYLSESQHDLVISFEEQFNNRGSLTARQFEILSDIFEKAADKVEWSR